MIPSDALNQEEIDALLTSVAEGQVPVDAPTTKENYQSFDFAAQDRIVRGRMPSLEIVNERFSRSARNTLFSFLRQPVEFSTQGVKIMKYSEYMSTLTVPTSLNLVKIHPLCGTALFALDAQLVFVVVEKFFGGTAPYHSKKEGRDFTQAESRIVQKMLALFFTDLVEAWRLLMAIDFEYQSSEVNPAMANVITPAEMVVVSKFFIELDGGGGNFHIALPYSMIEPIRELLENGIQSDRDDTDERWENALREEILDANIELSSTLAEVKTSLDKVTHFKVGDILPIKMPKKLCVNAEGVPTFRASFGVSNNQLALKIDSFINRPLDYSQLK